MRKIIQIAFEVSGEIDTNWNRDMDTHVVGGSTESTLHALCDDGTIWYWRDGEWNLWISAPIPQEAIVTKEEV